jgi:hypothetical protein
VTVRIGSEDCGLWLLDAVEADPCEPLGHHDSSALPACSWTVIPLGGVVGGSNLTFAVRVLEDQLAAIIERWSFHERPSRRLGVTTQGFLKPDRTEQT